MTRLLASIMATIKQCAAKAIICMFITYMALSCTGCASRGRVERLEQAMEDVQIILLWQETRVRAVEEAVEFVDPGRAF